MISKIKKLGLSRLWRIHREYLYHQHQLRYLFWECTLNCNFKCRHCGSRAGEKKYTQELSTEDIKKTFLDISQHFNPRQITVAVTGGEPLLRTDLFSVMKYASELGFSWGMVSNGSLVTKKIVSKAKQSNMKLVDISIDGIGSVHDSFRHTPGSYQLACRAIKLLQEADFLQCLRITTTVHQGNINSLEEMYQTFKSLGLKRWRLFNVEPIGRALDEDILLNKSQLVLLLDFIKRKRANKSGLEVTYGCANYLGIDYEDEVRNHFFYCGTGINIASILHNGDIFVCPNVPRLPELIQGNVTKDSFSEVWNTRFKFFRNQQRFQSDNCLSCEHWHDCLGGSTHSFDFSNNQPKICLHREHLYSFDKTGN